MMMYLTKCVLIAVLLYCIGIVSALYMALEELEKLRASSVFSAVIDQTYYSGEDEEEEEAEAVVAVEDEVCAPAHLSLLILTYFYYGPIYFPRCLEPLLF